MKNKKQVATNKLSFRRSSLFSGLMLAIGGLGQAAVIQVGTDCSLVEAMESANTDTVVNSCVSGNGDDIIRLQDLGPMGSMSLSNQHMPSVSIGGTYVGTPVVESHITIEGQGQTIRANTNTNKFRVFEVGYGGTLMLNDVTVSGGNDDVGLGSGVLNYDGELQVNNSKFYNNHGAITSIYGNTEINDSVIVSNFIENQGYAAGVYAYGSVFSLQGSSVINNRLSQIPPLWGENSTQGKFDLRSRGGGLNASGITLVNTEGQLINSTISGNKGFIGGLGVLGSSISNPVRKRLKGLGKKAKGGPNYSTLISQVTLADNSGYVGGFAINSGYSPLTIEGTIITGNTSEAIPEYANGYILGASAINVNAHNFVGENGQTKVYGLTLGASDTTFANSASDNLYPLNLSNGQFVHPLKHGSVAIDGLAKSCYQNISTDQEGKGRGIDGDSNGSFICDAGAFEHSLPIVVNSGACTLENAITSANIDGSVGGCQPGNGHDIIELPQGSVHSSSEIVETYNLQGTYGFGSGLPLIDTGLIINGNNSVINRDPASVEDFNLLTVAGGESGLILNDTTVTGANASLAAVASWYGNEIQLFNSNVVSNQAIGVLSALNHISGFENSNISQNTGDALFTHLPSGFVAIQGNNFRLSGNLISDNVGLSIGAGQLQYASNMVIRNNTISGNVGGSVGGLYFVEGDGIITHNTVTQNEGASVGGMVGYNAVGDLKLSHNIISGNVLTVPVPVVGDKRGSGYAEMNLNGAITSNNNIIGQNGSSGSNIALGPTDVIPAGSVDEVIAPMLTDNGGNTLSHLPVVGGIAVDTGSSDCEFNKVDQRNYIRPWDGDADGSAACDIGPIEVNSVHEDDLIFKDGFEDDSGII